jgi:hypothetical protein
MSVGLNLAIMKKALIAQPGNKFHAFPYVKPLFVTLFLFALLSLNGGEVWGQSSTNAHGTWFNNDPTIWTGGQPTQTSTVTLNHRVVFNAPQTTINIPGAGARTGHFLYITTGNYTFGNTGPDFVGKINASSTSNKNVYFDPSPSPSFAPVLLKNSLIQTPFGSKSFDTDQYFNGTLGIVDNLYSGENRIELVNNAYYTINTTNFPDPPSNTEAQTFSGSIFLDEPGGNYQQLLMYQNNNNNKNLSKLTLKRGITNFEGGAVLYNANILIEEGATLILGPLKCSACDPNDPSYPTDAEEKAERKLACENGTAPYDGCNQTRLEMQFGTAMEIKKGGRLIVYGSVTNEAQPGLLNINGGLYIVGNFSSRGNAVTSGEFGDIFTSGSMTTIGNSSIFGAKNIDCPGDCQATQVLCGWQVTTTPSGILPYCDGVELVGHIVDPDPNTNPDTNGKTFTWQKFNGTTWADLADPAPSTNTMVDNLIIPSPGANTEFYRLKASTGTTGCTSYSSTVSIVGTTANYWKGVTNDWHNETNWCLNLPNENQTVVIGDTDFDPLISATANVKDLIILNDASLTNNGNLNIFGDLYNFEELTSNNTGTVTFMNDATIFLDFGAFFQFHNLKVDGGKTLNLFDQTFAPIRLTGNLDLNNAHIQYPSASRARFIFNGNNQSIDAGVSKTITVNGQDVTFPNYFDDIEVDQTGTSPVINLVGGNLNLRGRLQLESASEFKSNGKLIIHSFGTSTFLDGSIAPILNGGSVSGDVTIQRYLDALSTPSSQHYRYIASPVTVAIPGLTPLRRYTTNWVSHTGSLTPGVGYQYRFGGESTLNFIGKLYSASAVEGAGGSRNWNFTRTGWHLIGNPYPSSIQWNNEAIAWTRSENVLSIIAVTDNSIEGYPNHFQYYDYTDDVVRDGNWGADNPFDGVIAMGQAFWVYVNALPASLMIHEQAKNNVAEGTFFRRDNQKSKTDGLLLSLDNGYKLDKALLNYSDKNESGKTNTSKRDVEKLWNEELNIYFLDRTHKEMLIKNIYDYEENIPLGVSVDKPGEYTITFINADEFTLSSSMYLIDRYEGKSEKINATGSYTFRVYNASKAINDRFYLSSKPEISWSEELSFYVYPNPVLDILHLRTQGVDAMAESILRDASGKVLDQAAWRGAYELKMNNFSNGLYILQVKTEQGIITRKIIKQ